MVKDDEENVEGADEIIESGIEAERWTYAFCWDSEIHASSWVPMAAWVFHLLMITSGTLGVLMPSTRMSDHTKLLNIGCGGVSMIWESLSSGG